jgi:Protein of unknown function (DUF1566)
MKRVFTILVAVLLTASMFAQSPEMMSYQAVIRNSSSQLMCNQTIGMQISILQGSSSGTAVYVETHTTSTNDNGLVSIEIGNGSVVSGDFSTINWSNGLFFIKTETAIQVPLTTYTITSTTQLLSVPFAFHSNSADTITGTISESDPVYSGSQAVNITVTDITNLGNLSGVNTGDQDISGIATNATAIANNTQAIQDTAAQIRADITSVATYTVGDFAHGGIVFWVDETGQHGLVCAKDDQSAGIRWYAGTYGSTQANGDGCYSGKDNTAIIIASQVAIGDDGTTYAARICNELQVTEGGKTYGDWYLPSKEELTLMYTNRATINGTASSNGGFSFAMDTYWSSTEASPNVALYYDFFAGYSNTDPKQNSHRIRAVRAF